MSAPLLSDSATESAEQLTRGHKKKARTRQSLVDAALRIYARKGSGELALNELADEAHVSQGTIYNYFRTREEVLEAVGIALAEQLSHSISVLSAGIDSGAERMAIGIRTFVRRAIADTDWANAVIQVIHYDQGIRSAVAVNVRYDLQLGLKQGSFIYSDEEVALALVVSCAIGAMNSIVEGRGVVDHDIKIAEMVLKALGLPSVEAQRIAHLTLPASESN
ncbi:TetR/AcrR family transcriptional regulator [Aquirhabdus sp.]|uniref:TetR/AcrR family transcriptional regulator n=1 Tax=Aquirhabdus sp. TaxID=2824160 RepID=UPI00396CCC36